MEVPYPVVLTLTDPCRPFIASPARRPFYRFGLIEACWILSGSDDLMSVASVNPHYREFSDDGRVLWGAYGPRLIAQLDHVLSSIRRDPDTRQAVVTTWRPMVHPGNEELVERSFHRVLGTDIRPEWDGSSWRSKDVPCTVAWHFQLRDGKLDLTVFMRSNDVWLGLIYDVLSFTTVQRVVASALGATPGAYNHIASNLHLYVTDLDAAQSVLNERPGSAPRMTDMGDSFAERSASMIARVFRHTLDDQNVSLNDKGLRPFIAAVANGAVTDPIYAELKRVNRR